MKKVSAYYSSRVQTVPEVIEMCFFCKTEHGTGTSPYFKKCPEIPLDAAALLGDDGVVTLSYFDEVKDE